MIAENIEMPKLMTIEDLKVYLGISHVTAYNLVKDRQFPSFKVGNKWMTDTEQLKIWMSKEMKRNP